MALDFPDEGSACDVCGLVYPPEQLVETESGLTCGDCITKPDNIEFQATVRVKVRRTDAVQEAGIDLGDWAQLPPEVQWAVLQSSEVAKAAFEFRLPGIGERIVANADETEALVAEPAVLLLLKDNIVHHFERRASLLRRGRDFVRGGSSAWRWGR